VHRGDIDHPAPTGLDHPREERLGEQERRGQQHGEQKIPRFFWELVHRADVLKPRVVDEDLNRPGLGDEPVHVLAIGEIRAIAIVPSAELADSSASPARSLRTTRAPAACKRRAVASPIPDAAPVTSAVRPWMSLFALMGPHNRSSPV